MMPRNCYIRHIKIIFFILITICICNNVYAAQKIFVSDEIRPRIRLHGGPIISGSEELSAGDRLLVKDEDYRVDYLNGVIYLIKSGEKFDTLTVTFTPLPTWLKKHYGIEPEINTPLPLPSGASRDAAIPRSQTFRSSTLSIKGAKKFSILSRSGGTSQFNQSLELTLRGELSPGLEVSGSVADRGYDPAYGTINSQISELDKLNLKVVSKSFYSEIGNLEVLQSSDFGSSVIKQVSGIQANFHNPHVVISGLFARPRGQFKTAKFGGIDRVQGPYRIISNNKLSAIVPGSEKVWMDGRLLERGADKDYIMDYPAATITFTQKVMIDSRSRIEIDFEPLTAEYQREMHQLSGGVSSVDSIARFRVAFIREGDRKDRLRAGELSSEDINLLQSIGDSADLNFRDGAVADTSGDFVELFDSLGFRYFEYIGDSLGDFRVSFTPVGMGQGDYVFEGFNVYRFVGRNNGDHLPVIRVPVPSREDFYEAELGIKPGRNSSLDFVVRQSDFDRNLYSDSDDNNNVGGQYILSARVGQSPGADTPATGAVLSANIINRNFKPRTRRNRPDLSRKYLLPENLRSNNDERELTLSSTVLLPGPYHILTSSGLLDYEHQFESLYGTISLKPDEKSSVLPALSFTRLRARYDTVGTKLTGEGKIITGKLNYKVWRDVTVISGFIYDRRWNDYSSNLRGTTERQYDIALKYRTAGLEIQRYDEDTLSTDWTNLLRRERAIFNLSNQFGPMRSELYLVGQKSRREQYRESRFQARLSMSYTPSQHNLSANASYTLSDENRFERGLRYIEVEPGEGKFISVDGQFVPDPEGNFIEIEEIHSNQASVSKGEKTFQLNYNPSDVYLKLVSNSTEELLADGSRSLLWVLPFYSDGGQTYLYRKLYYLGELKLLRYSGYYFVNLAASYSFESRRLGGSDYEKYEKVIRASLNESKDHWRYIQEGTYFEYLRDSYYSSPGNIDGFKFDLSVIRSFGGGQVNSSLSYRFAEDALQSDSKQLMLTVNPLIRSVAGGETSLKLEGYWQELNSTGVVSYRLTDNRHGEKGINWSLRSNYRIKKDLKISISFRGRHSDDRKPRIVGRGEVVASF